MNRRIALALLAVMVAALALRLVDPDARPMHNDEAVNALKLRVLWEEGRYIYDPHEFHGPALYYASLPALWFSPANGFAEVTEGVVRLVPALFGTGLIALLWLFRDGLGRRAILWAAVFTAVSPAMVFYSRYFIHEMALVFFTMLTLGAGWRWWRERRAIWAVLTGTGVGLMFATKETFVLAFGAMIAGVIGMAVWRRWTARVDDSSRIGAQSKIFSGTGWKHPALCAGTAALVWMVLFSSFFTNLNGLADSVRTYFPWIQRAGGESPHIHGWSFYLERLFFFHRTGGGFWSEGVILLFASAGSVVALRIREQVFAQFLVFYTVALTAIYCVIPYKTPWCALGFLHGLILLAGVGAAGVVNSIRNRAGRIAVISLAVLGAMHLGFQAWLASLPMAAARTNPYAYAQTSPDILNLLNQIEAVAATHPDEKEMVVKVMAPEHDYGPLLWYLRGFERVGWWDHVPPDPFAPVMVASTELNVRLDETSGGKWIMVGISELRPGAFLELYVETELWRERLRERTNGAP